MTQPGQPSLTRWPRIQHELSTLAFITRGGNWLFLLLSRLAEPLMFLSVLYVIAETVLPAMFRAPLFVQVSQVSLIILNTAPEVILPGCFMQASHTQQRHVWMFNAMGIVFLLLTFVTLASFIWHFPVGAVAVVLFFRCAAGVLFSLLVRMTPQQSLEDHQVAERVTAIVDHVSVHLGQVQATLLLQVQTVLQEMMQSQRAEVEEQVHLLVQQVCTAVQEQVHLLLVEQFQPLLQEHLEAVVQQTIQGHAVSHEKVLEELIQRLQNGSSTLRDVLPPGTQARPTRRTSNHPELSAGRQSRGAKGVTGTPLQLVQPVPVDRHHGQGNGEGDGSEQEPVQRRVQRYLTGQRSQGRTPSLTEIMAACHCAKGTAIRYRRELFGPEENVVASAPGHEQATGEHEFA